jgi:hypothetical protein
MISLFKKQILITYNLKVMKKILLFCLFSIGFLMLTHAQQLQFSTWTRFDSFVNDTVFLHFASQTSSYSSPDGTLVSSNYTEEGDTITIQDVSGPQHCSYSAMGTYTFTIVNGTALQFTLVSDACIGRVNSLTEGVYTRMPPKTIHVPADFLTIQQGIDAADNLDTVLVSDGIYYENINFLGKKPLLVSSEFLMDGDTSHISNTIIDGSHLTNMDSASVVYFISNEDTTSILCGFTIRGGKGTFTSDSWLDRDGGGIFITSSGAKIIHNRITGNVVDDTQAVNGANCYGAGIYANWDNSGYWVVIENNEIDSNILISQNAYSTGAGIYSAHSSRIFNNTVHNNLSYNTSADGLALGAIRCEADPSWFPTPLMIMRGNLIENNLAEATYEAEGSGISLVQCKIDFSNNEVSGNQVITTPDFGGIGGLIIANPLENAVVSHNIFNENSSNSNGGGVYIEEIGNQQNLVSVMVENNYFLNNEARQGGAILISNNPVILQNNVFSGNHASYQGGAVFCENLTGTDLGHMVTFMNNSFYGNKADSKGGAIFVSANFSAVKPLLINSVFWGNSAIAGKEIYLSYITDTVEIANSDIDIASINGHVLDGGGNIYSDPLFADTVYLIPQSWSPIIDEGTPSYTCACGDIHQCPQYDILGLPRPVGAGYDMGAYDMLYSGVGIHPLVEANSIVYPNPANQKISISVINGIVINEISIYNRLGQTIYKGIPVGNTLNVSMLEPGVYIIELIFGQQKFREKLIVE